MKKLHSICIVVLIANCLYAQEKIAINNTVPLTQLIEDNLVEGCFEISNISSSVNGSVNGFSSYGYFEQANSNFPFANGIVLSTGNANSGGNVTNTATLNEGQSNWGTDPDLEASIGISNTVNATSIEFDFISISNTIQFNYILASEEYFSNFPCEYSDGFAFLIRESSSTGPYQNIAIIPGTTIPVNTNTIHDEIVGFCPAENAQYFDDYNMGDTNFNGRTHVLSASANITPYTQYHIKLIIADFTDENYDSAVFIEGNSFNSVVDLGPDITTCADTVELNADIQNNQAGYVWYLNNVPIAGENSPTLNVTQSGTYRVEITVQLNNTNCVLEDEIEVNLSSEQTGTPIPDYELCDDPSGDGVETFNLSTMDSEVLASVPPANYTLSYHFNPGDAQNNINPISNSPLQNSANPQPIYIRLEDLDSGCLAFSTFNLVVNELPIITQPSLFSNCDTGIADGFAEFDLTEMDAQITNGNTALAVTYHHTQQDADDGVNAIPSPYTNITQGSEQLFIRVVNTLTGCETLTTVTIEVVENPFIDTGNHYLDACDPQHDGFATFDLTDIIPDVLQGLTNATVTFHETQEDANTGDNPIANDTNYNNTVIDEQIVYIRVVDNTTGCASVTPIEIHSNLLLTGTHIQDFAYCDDPSNDGEEDFNLNAIESIIAYDVPGVSITFYESEEDLENGTNPIDTSDVYTVSEPQTLYIEINNGACSEISEIMLSVNPVAEFGDIPQVDYCDTDDDGFTTVDLGSLDDHVTSGDPNFSVRYFATEEDAEDGTDQLPNLYTNTSNPQTLYVRIEDVGTACASTGEFVLQVIPAPTTAQPSNLIQCDNDQDAMYVVNLNNKIPEMVSSTSNLHINFYLTFEDADANINLIETPDAFFTASTPIFSRIESQITGCYAIENFDVIVNTLPIISNIENFQLCEDDNDFTTDFYLINKDEEILNGQTGKEVLYFETQNNALNNVNAINKTSAYQNTSSPQTIYIRVQNLTDPDCFQTGSFTISVAPNPIYNEPIDWLICDDATNSGTNTFDLNEKINEISQGSPDTLDISFHETIEDAQNNTNALPLNYTNTSNPQQLFVRIENQTFCTIVTSFGINILPAPEVGESQPLEICDNNLDGLSTFNLTDALFDILDVRQDDIEVTYYETMDDLELEQNTILDPENYNNTSNPQTVFIRVTNTTTACYQAIPLELIVNLPPQTNNVGTYETCETEDSTVDLSPVNQLVVNTTSGLTITYFATANDAANNQNPLDYNYIYSSPNTTLHIRVENNETGCFSTTSFVLQINPSPIANTAPDMEACDDDYDGLLLFDLTANDATILGPQNPNNYTITYHNSQLHADNGTEMMPEFHEAFDGEVVYVRVENNATGCYSTTIYTIWVREKPLINIPDQVPLCLNDVPLTVNASTNNIGDTYLWSTGATSASIDIYPNELGDYWVTVTTPYNCETTHNFTVIESEIATINFTTTVDFADPNSITVDISGNGEYVFSLDNGPWQESNVFNNVSMGLHLVTIRDLNGCNDVSQEVVVIDAPPFVTPNGDGYFDTWHIVGIEQLPGTIVYIFDRYGKLLKTLTHSSLGWDGTYRGNPMPTDDYWFLAEVKRGDSEFEVKGHFTLKR